MLSCIVLCTQALRETSGSDPVAALDWLCLHVPEAEVSHAFAPRNSTSGYESVASAATQSIAPQRKAFGRPFNAKKRGAEGNCA